MRCAGQARLLARFGSEALSLADPIEPPRSFVTGRDNGSEVTPDRLGLSRGPMFRQSAGLPAWLIARVFDYTRLFRMEGTLLRLKEGNHVAIMGPGDRTRKCAIHCIPISNICFPVKTRLLAHK